MKRMYRTRKRIKPSDLLLNGFGVGLGEEIEQGTAKVMRVAVGKSKLIGDGVDEQVAALGVEIGDEILKDVGVSRMRGMG